MGKINFVVLGAVMLFLFSTVLGSCGKKGSESESTIQQYKQKMETQLDQMQTRIKDLGDQIKGKQAEAKAGLEKELENLKSQEAAAKASLNSMKEKGGEAFDKVKSEIDEQMGKLETTYEDLKKRVQGS